MYWLNNFGLKSIDQTTSVNWRSRDLLLHLDALGCDPRKEKQILWRVRWKRQMGFIPSREERRSNVESVVRYRRWYFSDWDRTFLQNGTSWTCRKGNATQMSVRSETLPRALLRRSPGNHSSPRDELPSRSYSTSRSETTLVFNKICDKRSVDWRKESVDVLTSSEIVVSVPGNTFSLEYWFRFRVRRAHGVCVLSDLDGSDKQSNSGDERRLQ